MYIVFCTRFNKITLDLAYLLFLLAFETSWPIIPIDTYDNFLAVKTVVIIGHKYDMSLTINK